MPRCKDMGTHRNRLGKKKQRHHPDMTDVLMILRVMFWALTEDLTHIIIKLQTK